MSHQQRAPRCKNKLQYIFSTSLAFLRCNNTLQYIFGPSLAHLKCNNKQNIFGTSHVFLTCNNKLGHFCGNASLNDILLGFIFRTWRKKSAILFTALQIIVPFGVALPMVKKETSQRRRGRTQHKMADHEHPVYGNRLARLDNYFSQLEVCS
jgi:ribosomal protein S27E